MTLFGDGAWKEIVRLNEVIRIGPQPSRAGALTQEEKIPALSLCHVRTVRRWLSASQEEGSHQPEL